ncbi:alpha-1,6-mannosyl-glycoprotein 2-beta-N-acetylglucosaminyltransferase [Oncorhynchus tshawytscha]|uniref:alpha-1,6-mannosyl-glycoprotein 2-beta-N-acetylglucosaminyltransferase n=1 Tax=Oncorhynchus tshawytscha TaxID=74940 RepID=UPI000D09CCDE|nr:alpha-1,6-mannosyl-glycoprotein 2-beta-N-acetylglucosaminyltransferase [Oncorhynchus tshawytscha]
MRLRFLKKNLLIILGVSFIIATVMITTRVFISDEVTGVVAQENMLPDDKAKFHYSSVPELIKSIYNANYKQYVQNANKYSGETKLVLVIQVHNRPDYLKILIKSLENVAEVHNLLLIFSHDYFSEEINYIVQGITFCKVLQIYFPYSTQLYPSEFPGQDSRDCPRDISKDDALKTGCLNAEHPDSYGHYRDASITQTKHHWWWKLHFVWERVQALQGYSGFVVFLEEDNLILPDLYHLFKGMVKYRKSSCPDCDMLALGNYNGLAEFDKLSNKVQTAGWLSTKHNIGMGISREVYYKLMGCNNDFCSYDDYNWDWTLQHLSGTCISKPLKVLVAQGSRVLQTGNCGLHQNKEACRPELALKKAQVSLKLAKASLFPQSLALTNADSVEHKAHMKNGGWGDIRDHVLCKNYAKRL